MSKDILLITPPFTQLNTPYPATTYLKGFLNTQEISSFQCDLGIEIILELFSKKGLEELFSAAANSMEEASLNARRIFALRENYIQTVEAVISFLQGKNTTLAHIICDGEFLPEAARFSQAEDLDWAFGNMGIQDKAKHLATLYLEDLSDFIIEIVDPHFGFSRYAERLGRSANSFDELSSELQTEPGLIDKMLLDNLDQKIKEHQPRLLAISVPFPGNLFAAFRIGQFMKANYPNISVSMGGGFANTELRSLSETRVFDYFDYITLDDGERPILNLWEFLQGKRKENALKRTFLRKENKVEFIDTAEEADFSLRETGTPDYSDLVLDSYISVIEVTNPMHALWSNGRWNKLTLAHGCYWGRCTFCDTTLDYIGRFEPLQAKLLVDRMEELIAQTGEIGFHFVDEAAPPALLSALAQEILSRKLQVVWWTNIRFEKNFTRDLCVLLKESGCIAVSGGLEVASDRILAMINKGVNLTKVAKVTENFTAAGIMVHAYLMYGFPTQTVQETIDSLEVVRQLFMHGIVHSGFWHQFAMTAHSPVGKNPENFGVEILNKELGSFANNDLIHNDPKGAKHEIFSEGLRKSLFNFMNGVGFDMRLSDWFDFPVPRTTVPKHFIENILRNADADFPSGSNKMLWLGNTPQTRFYTKKKKGKTQNMVELLIHNKKEDLVLNIREDIGKWLSETLPKLSPQGGNAMSIRNLRKEFEDKELGDFDIFLTSYNFRKLTEVGLLIL